MSIETLGGQTSLRKDYPTGGPYLDEIENYNQEVARAKAENRDPDSSLKPAVDVEQELPEDTTAIDFRSMTVPQIKQVLYDREINFPPRANKEQLLGFLGQSTVTKGGRKK